MRRRSFITGVAMTGATLVLPPLAVAQDASLTRGVLMRARREFYGNAIDMRTDVYWFGDMETATKGVEDFCQWAGKDQHEENDIIVREADEVGDGYFGAFGNRIDIDSPHVENSDQLRLFAGTAEAGRRTKPVVTMVLQIGSLVQVWRVLSTRTTVLTDEVNTFFKDIPYDRGDYNKTRLLQTLPHRGRLERLYNGGNPAEMPFEEFIDYR